MRARPNSATLAGVLRCVIIDDNESFLSAATALLERQGLTVSGVASNTADALERVSELRPDVVLVDIALGTESGLELARRLVDAGDVPTVIVISTHPEADYADLIAETRATGFLHKSELSAGGIERLAS
jgi:two-component system, NarL family, nitrate/nitrite response regulator NarL